MQQQTRQLRWLEQWLLYNSLKTLGKKGALCALFILVGCCSIPINIQKTGVNVAIAYNTSVVRDGLVLHLDAANVKSYPGTGTVWKNLTNGVNNNIVNGTAYSSASNGFFQFDGVNDYVQLPTTFFNPNGGVPLSVSIWFRTSTSSGIIFGQTSIEDFTTASSYVPAIYVNTSGQLVTSCFWGNSNTNVSTTASSIANNTWQNITVTFALSSQKSYLNGSLYATLAKTQTTYSSIYYYFLGAGRQLSWPGVGANPYFTGSISSFMFYNKELTATEVSQNFNALRGRYGI